MPATVWGDEYVASLRNMLDETCRLHAVPDSDFFLNKRDYPQLHACGREPYGEFIGHGELERETYSAYLPIFSFYTGSDMADVPMPTTEDWAVATQRCFPPGSMSPPQLPSHAVPMSDREERAVFRGTATGRGLTADTNVRLRIAAFGARRPDLVDAGVTGYNTRDKVATGTPTDTRGPIVVDFMDVRAARGDALPLPPPPPPSRVPFMSMSDQFSRFAYVLYADGHCAASRYGTLMHSNCVILRVQSEQPKTCGSLWLFSGLTPCSVRDADTPGIDVPHDADHFLIDAQLKNLEATITFLRRNRAVAARVAGVCQRKAPTMESITTYWHRALCAVHVTCTAGRADEDGCREWFTPNDSKHARMRTFLNAAEDGGEVVGVADAPPSPSTLFVSIA